MENKYKVILSSEMEDEDNIERFEKIRDGNVNLYDFIVENLRRDNSVGIREDVLDYLSINVTDISTDSNFSFNIASMVCNIKITANHLEWVNQYYKEDMAEDKIKIDDFAIIFTEAVEKNIPLTKIKELFSAEKDEVALYGKIEDYVSTETENVEKSENIDLDEDEVNTRSIELKKDEDVMVETEKNDVSEYRTDNNEPGYSDIFNSLITVMSCKNKNLDESVLDAQENINKILAKFQLITAELSSYSSEIIHSQENDKEEIKRLNALLEIQQKILGSYQQKINEQRWEISRLNSRIQEAEKTEMRREEINNKISELQALTKSRIDQQQNTDYLLEH